MITSPPISRRPLHDRWIKLLFPLALILVACMGTTAAPTPTITQISSATPTSTRVPPSSTPGATATPTATVTPTPIDYEPLRGKIQDYLNRSGLGPKFDMAIGFVDIQTGQTFSFDGETRHYALSTFKGPLAAFYLWLVERGQIEVQPSDEQHIIPMLAVSSNTDTSCVIKRVGGLTPFNDWLAEQGLSRQNNFVASWQSWACRDDGEAYIAPLDMRYMEGDKSLGLPGNYALFQCYPTYRRCDKAFAPLELAAFYARVYRGDVLNPEDTIQWLDWMEKSQDQAALLANLPGNEPIHGYVKNGFRIHDDSVSISFYHEAGVVETPNGAFALAVFTEGDPYWPATKPLATVGQIIYDYFVTAHEK
jgi:hypothetical protein